MSLCLRAFRRVSPAWAHEETLEGAKARGGRANSGGRANAIRDMSPRDGQLNKLEGLVGAGGPPRQGPEAVLQTKKVFEKRG